MRGLLRSQIQGGMNFGDTFMLPRKPVDIQATHQQRGHLWRLLDFFDGFFIAYGIAIDCIQPFGAFSLR